MSYFDKILDDFISPLHINQLKGRYLKAPAFDSKNNQHIIVLIYGHHASIERNIGLIQYLRDFGQVIMPDLPGFGGMDSFYKIKKIPSFDNYADFLNDFFKTQNLDKKKITLIGFSWGFLITNKFLQKYPNYQKNVTFFISLVGFLQGKVLQFSRTRRFFYFKSLFFIKTKIGSTVFRCLFLNKFMIKNFYAKTFSAKSKFIDLSPKEKEEILNAEVHLWHCNDVRTWAFTADLMLKANLVDKRISVQLYHIFISKDQYLNHRLNKISLQKVYNRIKYLRVDLATHAPTVIVNAQQVKSWIPKEVNQILKTQSQKTSE